MFIRILAVIAKESEAEIFNCVINITDSLRNVGNSMFSVLSRENWINILNSASDSQGK